MRRRGFVHSLARPGGKLTGFASLDGTLARIGGDACPGP